MHDLKGKIALVTGASGDIGECISRRFLQCNAAVHITDIDGAILERKTNKLSRIGNVCSSVADLADHMQVQSLASTVLNEHGRIDYLVNNAAIQALGDLNECSPELFDAAYAVNVRAPFLLAKLLVPAMREVRGGAIINISSVHATAPGPRRLAYATTKTALLGLTRSLAVDLGVDNIRVNAVSPGATLTSQLVEAWKRQSHSADLISGDGADPDIMAHAKRQHPLGRIVSVEDVADAVLFLAEANSITGFELRVDSGLMSSLRLLPSVDNEL